MNHTYLLVSNGTALESDGSTIAPEGVVVNRIVWDGVASYTPPSGTYITDDDGTSIGTVTNGKALTLTE